MRSLTILVFAIALSLCGSAPAEASPLTIQDASLPSMDAGVETRILLHALGGVPPYQWTIAGGELPEGIFLTADGVLTGCPRKPGPFALTVRVTDSDHPAHSITKDFQSQVNTALLLEWLRFPAIHGNQVDGAVRVSNGSQDNFDLTVFIVAVNDVGRATSLHYRHFNLGPGTTDVPIAFAETLPRGTYVVHADAIAEIAKRNTILRQRLQTPNSLDVTQGP